MCKMYENDGCGKQTSKSLKLKELILWHLANISILILFVERLSFFRKQPLKILCQLLRRIMISQPLGFQIISCSFSKLNFKPLDETKLKTKRHCVEFRIYYIKRTLMENIYRVSTLTWVSTIKFIHTTFHEQCDR